MKLQIFRFFEIKNNHYYYNDYENEFNIKKISENTYLPANKILLDLIHFLKGEFKMSILFSGVVLDQFELYAPEMLDSYNSLIDTGCVELLTGTYSNTFGPLSNCLLYENQQKLQKERVKLLFNKEPIALPDRNLKYSGAGNPGIRILSNDTKLNEILSLDFSSGNLSKLFKNRGNLIKALNACRNNDCVVDIFIPYSISGDYQRSNKGLLEFLESFTSEVLSKSGFTFAKPSETDDYLYPSLIATYIDNNNYGNIESFYKTCNELQIDAFEKLYSYVEKVEMCDDLLINKDWLYLQTCDHFYFMDPVLYESGEFHGISLPYDSPYFAYINYMNVLMDFSDRLDKWLSTHKDYQKCQYAKNAKFDKYEPGSTSFLRTKKFAGNLTSFAGKKI